jgi:hypothetical protein
MIGAIMGHGRPADQKITFAAEKRAAAILIQRLTSLCRGPTQESQSARRAEWSHSGLDERYPGLAEQ